ncbi:MAG TPA: peptidoglycan DD-metalloendopeptidase family protein [Xanthobacteraceae bacterium]|nr:peptidoglycan DD-metalloendopeptidase family protein [Xanthobacteraceae bacterium]
MGQAAPPPDNLDALKQSNQDLNALQAEQQKAADTEAKLKREIASIGDDRRRLNQQLIDTAMRIRSDENQIASAQDRLKPLDAREQALRQSLDQRRGLMAEILAALQRIGRHPPPALMVSPQDALQSLRSAMILGAVLPEMRQEADQLIADLTELTRLRAQIAMERDALTRELALLGEEHQRLSLLTEQRQKQLADSEQALEQEHQRAAQLARQADNLKDLIAKLEQSPGPTGHDDKPERPDLAALGNPGRLAPAIAFAAAKGRLPLPVNGVRIKEFGAPDGLGGTEKGLTVATRPGAQITAPCDGWVVYAGPFRNYGQLLILNAGSGYHVLLAGMERISVDLGQFVVTGEPVAIMGDGGGQVPAALAASSAQPVLYVEFRKDGTPVDPSPWWATNDGEKVRG